jgi:hypothetical protein
MLRTGVVITDGNNLHAKPGGKKVVDQLAKDDRLWVLEEVQHRKKWLMVQPWRQGGQGYVIADAVRIDNATDPVGAGNSPPLAPTKSDEMPAPPNRPECLICRPRCRPWDCPMAHADIVRPASYSKRKTASGFGASQVRPKLPSPLSRLLNRWTPGRSP